MIDTSGVGIGGVSMLERGVKMVQVTYLPLPRRLYGERTQYTTTYKTTETVTSTQKRNNDTYIVDVE